MTRLRCKLFDASIALLLIGLLLLVSLTKSMERWLHTGKPSEAGADQTKSDAA